MIILLVLRRGGGVRLAEGGEEWGGGGDLPGLKLGCTHKGGDELARDYAAATVCEDFCF